MSFPTHIIDWLAILALMTALIAAALSDLASYLIPNRYSAAIAVAFGVYAAGKPIDIAATGLAIGLLLFALGAVLFSRGMFGGGDVKLLAATGLWAGTAHLPVLLLVTALAGGVLGLAQLVRVRFLPAPAGGDAMVGTLRAQLQQPIPFGVAIAAGGIGVALALAAP